MLEKRRHPRVHVLRRGSIVFGDGRCAIGCIVLDLSPGGARLRVRDWLGMPEAFELRIENGPVRQARVRYRDLETTGVQFAERKAA